MHKGRDEIRTILLLYLFGKSFQINLYGSGYNIIREILTNVIVADAAQSEKNGLYRLMTTTYVFFVLVKQ